MKTSMLSANELLTAITALDMQIEKYRDWAKGSERDATRYGEKLVVAETARSKLSAALTDVVTQVTIV
jgi:hypothetical protein